MLSIRSTAGLIGGGAISKAKAVARPKPIISVTPAPGIAQDPSFRALSGSPLRPQSFIPYLFHRYGRSKFFKRTTVPSHAVQRATSKKSESNVLVDLLERRG